MGLLGSFGLLTFSKADTRAAAVLVDEVDAGEILRAPVALDIHYEPTVHQLLELLASQSKFQFVAYSRASDLHKILATVIRTALADKAQIAIFVIRITVGRKTPSYTCV